LGSFFEIVLYYHTMEKKGAPEYFPEPTSEEDTNHKTQRLAGGDAPL
jgi:hypothetical protein